MPKIKLKATIKVPRPESTTERGEREGGERGRGVNYQPKQREQGELRRTKIVIDIKIPQKAYSAINSFAYITGCSRSVSK